MNLEAIVQTIDEEIDRLSKVRALLTGPLKRGMPSWEAQEDERGGTGQELLRLRRRDGPRRREVEHAAVRKITIQASTTGLIVRCNYLLGGPCLIRGLFFVLQFLGMSHPGLHPDARLKEEEDVRRTRGARKHPLTCVRMRNRPRSSAGSSRPSDRTSTGIPSGWIEE
jgi:hypothetical protein